VLAHQAHQVYYLSYPHQSLKAWWVVYKVNKEVHPYRYNNYNISTDDDDIVYQEVSDQADDSDDDNIVSEGAGLNELASLTLELMVEPDPPNSKRQKSTRLLEKQQRVEQLNARVTEEDSDVDDF
jgi:hypothetical protein